MSVWSWQRISASSSCKKQLCQLHYNLHKQRKEKVFCQFEFKLMLNNEVISIINTLYESKLHIYCINPIINYFFRNRL